MAQDMTFAQALNEARQIIVQQSGRIKSDLEKIKSLQDTAAAQTAAILESERKASEQAVELQSLRQEVQSLTVARAQAEAVVDRQGQRLTQMQTHVAEMERQVGRFSEELKSLREQLPTTEDTEALAALSTLLSTKKVSAPAVNNGNSSGSQSMRLAPAPHAEAA